ncbi:MAG TPA: adenylate/guanylate cyclase domain-containing protein [Candidatus Dormibacteraeota bacterium]|nr:adenylate/guanylate cyclase domain-containing protein [Candidatus Dormibacteraeota bacterium]
MSLRDGTLGQKLRFAALVAVALLGLGLAVTDKVTRVGTPNVGWLMDGIYVSPTRQDASDAGLRGGGRALSINGIELPPGYFHGHTTGPGLRTEDGASNTLRLRTPSGVEREITLAVRPWRVEDFVFTQGVSDLIGLLFLAVGVITFTFRPYEPPSWALLSLCALCSGTLLTTLLPVDDAHPWAARYFLALVGFVAYVPLHTALAFPVVHPLLVRRPRILWLIYAAGAAQAVFNLTAWHLHYEGPFAYSRTIGSTVLLLGIGWIVARCAQLALHTRDPLVAQRARILLAGSLLGSVPIAVVQFLRETFGALEIDNRFLLWPLGIFVLALARVTVRPALMNARIAVRKAVLYTAAVAILTAAAMLLTAVRPYAVAALLFPLLYFWPRFEARLNRRLYPERARFPALLHEMGDALDAAESGAAVLDVLAAAPGRLCDARSAVAFLLADGVGSAETVRHVGVRPDLSRPLGEELVVQLMRATRRAIGREQLAVEPQYTNIRAECEAGFARLGATLLLPLVHDQRVLGGLAVGGRASGDPYETEDVHALDTACQQTVQSLIRVAATERLRAREREFADLKRYFPPQIIDQVMARGGAAELGSQRKLVTVLFADLRGFTSFSDSVEPEEVIATLDEYHTAMGARIAEFEGTLEHFAGDGFMVFFNDPLDQPDHAERAARMALAMRDDVERLRLMWTRQGYNIHVGMGIHSGYATCGFIGYEGRRDYAVIGNVTNLAARLSDAAGPGEILISARSYGELRGFLAEPAGDLTLKGFHQPQPAFKLLAAAGAQRASG